MKRISYFTVLLSLFWINSAVAFDHMYCEADLKGWTITNLNKDIILSSQKPNVNVLEQDSHQLYIKDEQTNILAVVYPWNGLHIQKSSALTGKHEVTTSEGGLGFVIKMIDKKSLVNRSLACRFGF